MYCALGFSPIHGVLYILYILWGYTTIFNYVINVVCEMLDKLKYAFKSLRTRV